MWRDSLDARWLKLLPKKNQWWIVLLIGILLIVVATPTKTSTKTTTEQTQGTELEERLEGLLESMTNVGKVQVMITSQKNGDVEGIVVLADGAKDPVVVRHITDVVQALFQVDAHKIKVIERNLKMQEESL